MSHLQFLKSLSTPIMKFKNKKYQQLRNTSAVASAYGNKRSNGMRLSSFDYKISHQRRAEILDV